MISFDYRPNTRIVFGSDKIHTLGELASELGACRVLLVSDPGVIAAGHMQQGLESLELAGIQTDHFDEVHENPTTVDVDTGLEVAKRFEPDLLVGLGGGSAMDCTKGINFLYTNDGCMSEYWGDGRASKPMLPMIAVPTTAGTGSEVQSFALISDAKTHTKMACGDEKAAPRVALLDPKLTLTQPPRVMSRTGIDALAHALETFVTKRRNPVSLAFSSEAWRLLAGNFARVLDNPEDLEARSGMQLGACFAGLAIENSMLGAAHALANPLTADFGIVHGEAVGVMLPHVIRFNGVQIAHHYQDLMEITAGRNGYPDPHRGVDGLADFVSDLITKAGLPSRLSEYGVDQQQLPKLAADAARQWTVRFNPRLVEERELNQIYQQAF